MSGWSFTVPRANVLTNIAAEHVSSHAFAQFLGNIAALLDGQIRDATVGIQLVGRDERIGGAGINTARAGAAAVWSGKVRWKLERSDDDAKKEPRARLLIQNAGVFPDPSHAGVLGVYAFHYRTGVHVTERLYRCLVGDV